MKNLVLNGLAAGGSLERLLDANMDPRVIRPWKEAPGGQAYITMNEGGQEVSVPVNNANSLLRKDDWVAIDRAIVKVAKPRLRAVSAIRKAGCEMVIANGMSKTQLDTEVQSDVSEATESMDGLRESTADRPYYGLGSLPLPITHKDFYLNARQLSASRNGGSPLDTATAELAARRVAERIEQVTLGTATGMTFGGNGGTIYGLTNFTSRLLKTLTAPTATGWVGKTLITEVLAMILQAKNAYHFGPYILFTSLDWDPYLDDDYKATTVQPITLRERLKKIGDIKDVVTLDYLPSKTMILLQLTPEVIRMVVGMDLVTVQWESHGGMRINFKVMGIIVPQVRADANNNTGIVHGSYS